MLGSESFFLSFRVFIRAKQAAIKQKRRLALLVFLSPHYYLLYIAGGRDVLIQPTWTKLPGPNVFLNVFLFSIYQEWIVNLPGDAVEAK